MFIVLYFIFLSFFTSTYAKDYLTDQLGQLSGNSTRSCADCVSMKSTNIYIKSPPIYPVKGRGKHFGLNRRCRKFIKNGKLGKYGKYLVKELRKYKIFYEKKIISSNTCNKFSRFSKEEIEGFWVSMFESLSYDESGCKPRIAKPGMSNRIATGLFQIELTFKNRRRAARNKYCLYKNGDKKRRIKANMKNVKDNIACSIGQMNDQLKKYGSIYTKRSYWHHLRPMRKKMSKKKKRRYLFLREYISSYCN